MRSRRRLAAVVAAAAVLLAAFWFASGADEGEMLRQIKTDVFDQKWDSVLAGCDQFIAQFTRSQALPRAYYYRGQALEHTKGREELAIAAYTDFLTRFPDEKGAIREDALLSRMTLATSLHLKGNRNHIGVILQGMDLNGYPSTFAAIQASKIDHKGARAKAIPILEGCAASERDAELKSECAVALLRIDPQRLAKLPPPEDGRAAGAPEDEAKLIRVEVFDKLKKQVTVKVNMPVAFAELALGALSEEYRQELDEGLKKKGLSLSRIWDAFKGKGKQIIIEVDEEDVHIKVWVE